MEVVTELRVDLATVLDHMAVCLEGLHVVLHGFVDLFRVFLELSLQSLSEAITRLPYLQLHVEVLEALLDKFHVQNARHALLCLAEGVKFGLQHMNVKFGEILCFKFLVGVVLLGLLFSISHVDFCFLGSRLGRRVSRVDILVKSLQRAR